MDKIENINVSRTGLHVLNVAGFSSLRHITMVHMARKDFIIHSLGDLPNLKSIDATQDGGDFKMRTLLNFLTNESGLLTKSMLLSIANAARPLQNVFSSQSRTPVITFFPISTIVIFSVRGVLYRIASRITSS